MCHSIDLATNRLVDMLSPGAGRRLLPALEVVELRREQVLHESGLPMSGVYFPRRGTVSLRYETENGASFELAMVGNEGVVGVELFLGGSSVPHRAVVSTEGRCYRLPAPAMREEFGRGGSTMHLMLRYTGALITQVAQTAVCNRHHSLNQRLCRWLLLTTDRLDGAEVSTTHERIARMLGVRREGVTDAALDLQHAGVIRNSRGRILVLDRRGLETRACECYAVLRSEYERLLRRPPHGRPSPDRGAMFECGVPAAASCAGDEHPRACTSGPASAARQVQSHVGSDSLRAAQFHAPARLTDESFDSRQAQARQGVV